MLVFLLIMIIFILNCSVLVRKQRQEQQYSHVILEVDILFCLLHSVEQSEEVLFLFLKVGTKDSGL